jgi:hypothetical protein
LSTEPETGTELQRRGETLPDVTVAHRAGSIVSEFVSSIVDEAATRGGDIIAEAHEEARGLRREASEGIARRHERVEVLARELSALLGDVREATQALSGEPGEPGEQASLPPRLTPEFDQGAGAPEEAPEEAHVMEAIVVEEGADDEVPAELVAAGQNGSVDSEQEPEDPRVRVTRMTDEELARAYTNAVRASQGAEGDPAYGGDPGYADWLRSLAEAAVEEALRRPAFVDGEPEAGRGLRFRAGARRRRRRAVLLSELREACRQAREQHVAAGWPGA